MASDRRIDRPRFDGTAVAARGSELNDPPSWSARSSEVKFGEELTRTIRSDCAYRTRVPEERT